MTLGRFDQALADLNRAVELDPEDADSFAIRGQAFRRLGREKDALADLARAAALDPDFEPEQFRGVDPDVS